MSDTGHEGRAWRHYVRDMIDFARTAVAYTQGKTQADFVAVPKLLPALQHLLDTTGKDST